MLCGLLRDSTCRLCSTFTPQHQVMWPRYPVICHSRNQKKERRRNLKIFEGSERRGEQGTEVKFKRKNNFIVLYKSPSARRAELCFPVCVFAADGRAGGSAREREWPGNSRGGAISSKQVAGCPSFSRRTRVSDAPTTQF